jgi:hypothetical protein
MATQINTIETVSETQKQASMTHLLKWIPHILLSIASVLLLVSISLPYWGMILEAPQYPGGLEIHLFVNQMAGNEETKLDEVREIDNLNHYIGMASLFEAAELERQIAVPGIIVMAVALVIVAFIQRRWVWLLAIPALTFPFVFLGDLAFWLNYYGQNLDPYAPLSSSIKPFTPMVLGESTIGQFKTIAYVDIGWSLAMVAAGLVLTGLLFRLVVVTRLTRSK